MKMIVKNRLLDYKDMVIYQDTDNFLFSLDSLLLADFTSLRLTDKYIIDLCTGNAPIPILLSFRTKGVIYGVEIQKSIYDLAVKSVLENNLSDKIKIINDDVKNLISDNYQEKFDVVVCNPPYFKYQEDALVNENECKSIARHEIMVTLEDIIRTSKYILRTGGKLNLVHRPDRFMEILWLMRKYGIEVKRIRFVYPKKDRDANLLLIEGVKGGKTGLKVMQPLIVHEDNGDYTSSLKKMFGSDIDVAK